MSELCGRPLTFGDIEQINEIKRLDLEARQKEATKNCKECGGTGTITEECCECNGIGEFERDCEYCEVKS